MYRVYFTFLNPLGDYVRDYLDDNGAGFTLEDAQDLAKELWLRGHKDIRVEMIGHPSVALELEDKANA